MLAPATVYTANAETSSRLDEFSQSGGKLCENLAIIEIPLGERFTDRL
jgi:hypothetical protein